jgi:hypothetical protein
VGNWACGLRVRGSGLGILAGKVGYNLRFLATPACRYLGGLFSPFGAIHKD